MKWLQALIAFLADLYDTLRGTYSQPTTPPEAPKPAPEPSLPPKPPVPMPTVPESAPDPLTTLLPWDMKGKLSHANFHNVRVICDQEGLTFQEKEELTATVWGESDFYVLAECKNFKTLADGTKHLASTDHGICQWNDYWHPEISNTPYTPNPEKEVRAMCKAWKHGELIKRQWIAFKSGRYRAFLGKRL